MRGTESEQAVVAAQGYWTPQDFAFDSVTWTKAGITSLDVMVEGMSRFCGFAISDDAWAVDLIILNEDESGNLFGPIQVATDIGVLNGQVGFTPFFFTTPVPARRIKFRGRRNSPAGTTANSTLRLFANSAGRPF